MRGLDPRIHQMKKSFFEKMDCRVKPGNDDTIKTSVRRSRPAPVMVNKTLDQALTPAPTGHDTPVPPSPQ
jgi:ribosomal protein S19